MKPSRRSATWFEEEVPIGPSFRAHVRRLLRRGRASWFLWAPLALLIGFMMARSAARHIIYSATVVLWGTVARPENAADAEAGLGRLRSYVHDWAFTGDHLLEVMDKYPQEFPDARTRPSEAIESMRSAIELTIGGSDFIEDRAADDPPPSARITVSYAARTPDLAVTMARELARLVVSSSLNRQGEMTARAQAATETALKQTETSFEAVLERHRGAPHDRAQLAVSARAADDALDSLRAAVVAATKATLANRGGEENEMLHFNVVDWGHPPALRSNRLFTEELIVLFAIGLLTACVLAGAFDPRILDRIDLSDAGLSVLGHVPRLPDPPSSQTPAVPSQPTPPILS